jgi:dolichol-phosphate mannosyltransferase
VDTTVVLPTYNEFENLRPLVEEILSSADVKIIVVDDDSSDGTAELADELSNTYEVEVIHRRGERGLASAILAGFQRANTSIVGVMDADFQHPPAIIAELVEKIEDADLVIASRKAPGGGVGDWSIFRRITSWGATLLAKPLTDVGDPMSGCFLLKKDVIEGVDLDAIGYKLGLEILVKGKYKKVMEVPYIFQGRLHGRTKLGAKQYINYIKHLVKLYSWRLTH